MNTKLSARAADAPSEPSDEEIVVIARQAIRDGSAMWDHFQKDDAGKFTVPVLDPKDFMLVRAVLSAVKSRAADALDSQPTGYATMYKALEKIAAPATDSCGCDFPCQCETEAAEELNAEGLRSRARVALDLVDAAKVVSSQPTDGGVRNG